MVLSSSIFGIVVLAAVYISSPANAADPKPFPWDGRCSDIAEVKEKYLTDILTMRKGGEAKVEDYVSVEQDGRKPGFNDDTGVINIKIDDKAIFKEQINSRRSELAQIVKMNPQGTTVFHGSVMKKEPFQNQCDWQLMALEEKGIEIRVTANSDPTLLVLVYNGTDIKWETPFRPGIWYNLAFGVSRGATGNNIKLKFYESVGEDEPVEQRSDELITPFTETQEYRIGLLTLSVDGSEPKVDQDVVSYNGVSVDNATPNGKYPHTPPHTHFDNPPNSLLP